MTEQQEQEDSWGLEHPEQVPRAVRGHLRFHQETAAHDLTMSRLLEIVTLVVSAAVPVAAAFHAPAGVLALIGATATVLVSVNARGRYRENWLRHNQVVLAIQHHLVRFDYRLPPYNGTDGDRQATLAVTVEDLVQAEAAGWAEQQRTALPPDAAVGPGR